MFRRTRYLLSWFQTRIVYPKFGHLVQIQTLTCQVKIKNGKTNFAKTVNNLLLSKFCWLVGNFTIFIACLQQPQTLCVRFSMNPNLG